MSDSHIAGRRPDQLEELRYMGLRTKHAELDCRITATAECSPTLNARSSPQAKSSVHLLAHIFPGLCHQRLGVCGEHDMLNALLPDLRQENPGLLQCIRRAAILALARPRGLCRIDEVGAICEDTVDAYENGNQRRWKSRA